MYIEIYVNVILPVVLYGCKTFGLSHRVREGGRLTVLENRLLRKVFLCKKDEVIGEWRRLYKEELYDLYSSLNIILGIKWRRMCRAGHVARIGEWRAAYGGFVGKPEGKRPLGRTIPK
jgi:hypothetical protein